MLTNNYDFAQYRETVLDIFKQYLVTRKNFREILNVGDGLDDAGKDYIQREADNVEKNKYILAIVGESKSGKSTFINALLGKSILPTGILQCTSGITEVIDTDNDSYNKSVFLKVRYGHSEELKTEFEGCVEGDITPLQERLKSIAALREEYRNLPVFQINQLLLAKKPVKIHDELIKEECRELLKDENNNPYKLSKEAFEKLVRSYMEDYKDLSKIAVDISIGYPLGLKFAHIQLVDTPGVNARGGLEKATLDYIGNANAVFFIHTLTNIASGSLGEFFKKVPNRSYKNIFMCLTRKAQHKVEDVDNSVTEIRRLFPEIQPEERIIAVDSMLKLIYDELCNGKTLKEIRQDEEKRKIIADYIIEYESDLERIKSALLADSNFIIVHNLLLTFSEHALTGQFQDIIKPIARAYEEQRKVYDDQIRLIGWKTEFAKTHEQFEQEIDRLERLLDNYQTSMNKFSQEKNYEYKGRYSKVNTTFSIMKEMYDRLLGSAENTDQLRKHIVDFNDECDKKFIGFISQLSREYETEMVRVGAEFDKKHNISPPKIDLTSISEEAKKQAYETITVPGNRVENTVGGIVSGGFLGALIGISCLAAGPIGWAFIGGASAAGAIYGGTTEYLDSTSTKKEYSFNNQKYQTAIISEARNLVASITDSIPQQLSELLNSYNKQFMEKLDKIIKERQVAYEQLKKDQENSLKLKQLDDIKNVVEKELEKINNVTTILSSIC